MSIFIINEPFSLFGKEIRQDVEFSPDTLAGYKVDKVCASIVNGKYFFITTLKMLYPGNGDGTRFLTALTKSTEELKLILSLSPRPYDFTNRNKIRLYKFYISNGFLWNIRRNRLEDCPGMMYRPIGGKAREKFVCPEKSLDKVFNNMLEACQKNEKKL